MTDKGKGIRPYGLGKFNTILDAYVYSVSLNGGTEEEVGESSGMGWYGIMRHGSTIFKDHGSFQESLNEEERELLTSAAGVIISEDSQGFVSVEYFTDTKALETTWSKIETESELFGDNNE